MDSTPKILFVYSSDYSFVWTSARDIDLPLTNPAYKGQAIETIQYRGFDDSDEHMQDVTTAPTVALIEIFPEGNAIEDGIANRIISILKKDFPATQILLWFGEEKYKPLLSPDHTDHIIAVLNRRLGITTPNEQVEYGRGVKRPHHITLT